MVPLRCSWGLEYSLPGTQEGEVHRLLNTEHCVCYSCRRSSCNESSFQHSSPLSLIMFPSFLTTLWHFFSGFSSFTSWLGILRDFILDRELISSWPVFSLSSFTPFPGLSCWWFLFPFLWPISLFDLLICVFMPLGHTRLDGSEALQLSVCRPQCTVFLLHHLFFLSASMQRTDHLIVVSQAKQASF